MQRKANPRGPAKPKAPWGAWNTRVFFGYASPTTVRRCINAGANPNARDEHERTPLHFATMREDSEIVRVLLNAGADPNARTKRGQTPLHHAAPLYHATHPDTVRALLNAGADPNICTDDGEIPLHCAVRWDLESVQALLEAGANPNAQTDRDTPLCIARGIPKRYSFCSTREPTRTSVPMMEKHPSTASQRAATSREFGLCSTPEPTRTHGPSTDRHLCITRNTLRRCGRCSTPAPRNLSTTLRHRRLRFTEQSLLLWIWQVG